jgi:hypothetical protein
MTQVRMAYLAAARVAAELAADPVVSGKWEEPSVLPRMSVGALTAHLTGQIDFVVSVLGTPSAAEPVIPLLEYYERIGWIGKDLDDPFNLRIQRGEAKAAASGPGPVLDRVRQTLAEAEARLPTAPDRPVHLPVWGQWSLAFDDFVITRMLELLVHSDDLAASVGRGTGYSAPEVPPEAADIVVTVLARLAVRRHGASPVLRALSRTERAGGIAAI